MVTNRKAAIKMLKQLIFTPKSETETFRLKIEDALSVPILANNVQRTERNYGGIICDMLEPTLYASHRIMLYIHGGSFIGGSRASWRSLCASLATVSSCRVVLPEIRLAPAHPYPAALEDIQAVFTALFSEEEISCTLDADSGDKKDPDIIIAADGSGASQALAFLLNLKERYRKAIKHVILLSPWLDLSSSSPVIMDKKSSDEVLTGESLRKSSEVYTFASNLDNPYVSPMNASDDLLKGFPPVYIQIGEKELLLADAKRFQTKLINTGNTCTLDIWPNMMYMFQFADAYLPESHLAIERIGKMITARPKDPEDNYASYKFKIEKSLNADA